VQLADKSGLVYCSTRLNTRRIARALLAQGYAGAQQSSVSLAAFNAWQALRQRRTFRSSGFKGRCVFFLSCPMYFLRSSCRYSNICKHEHGGSRQVSKCRACVCGEACQWIRGAHVVRMHCISLGLAVEHQAACQPLLLVEQHAPGTTRICHLHRSVQLRGVCTSWSCSVAGVSCWHNHATAYTAVR
jgi:hypothetical protein